MTEANKSDIMTYIYYVVILFCIERLVFSYNEYSKLIDMQVNDHISAASCRKLNYRDIAKEHVEMCDRIELRINTPITVQVFTNAVNDVVNKPVTIHTVVKTVCVALIALVLNFTQSFYTRLSRGETVLPYNYKRIKID